MKFEDMFSKHGLLSFGVGSALVCAGTIAGVGIVAGMLGAIGPGVALAAVGSGAGLLGSVSFGKDIIDFVGKKLDFEPKLPQYYTGTAVGYVASLGAIIMIAANPPQIDYEVSFAPVTEDIVQMVQAQDGINSDISARRSFDVAVNGDNVDVQVDNSAIAVFKPSI